MKKGIWITSITLLLTSVLLLVLANQVSGFAQWYSVVVYDALVGILARIFGIVPYSVVELLLYLLILSCIFFIGRFFVLMIKNWTHKKSNKKWCLQHLSGFVLLVSALFFGYVVNCGVNYHRDSFSKSSGIELEPYTMGELIQICEMGNKNAK